MIVKGSQRIEFYKFIIYPFNALCINVKNRITSVKRSLLLLHFFIKIVGMILIDGPFASDFLLNTIRKNKYKVIATKAAKELINDSHLNWISEEEAILKLNEDPNIILYTNSENALSWIESNLNNSKIHQQIRALKDKVKFREISSSLFPGFEFKKVNLNEIQHLSVDSLPFPFVIKPAIGFFSIGVHIVKNIDDWNNAKEQLTPKNLKSIFPESVLNTSHFIIESFIEGEEYAIDHYFDEKGDIVILNVMHHLFSSGKDTSDRVYTTSKDIILEHFINLKEVLGKIGKQLELKNFPAHAEVRINSDGTIIPIEINPLRFGGWCTTGDILGVSIGFNSYENFFSNRKPNWDEIFKGKEDKLYSMVALDNNSGIAPENIENFNYSKLAKEFENTVLTRTFDIKKYPTFGFLFLETSRHNQSELDRILTSNLRDYITVK